MLLYSPHIFEHVLHLGADYMSRASPVSRADSCHEYLFQTTKEDLNQFKGSICIKTQPIFLLNFILREF